MFSKQKLVQFHSVFGDNFREKDMSKKACFKR